MTWLQWLRQEIFALGTSTGHHRMQVLKYTGGLCEGAGSGGKPSNPASTARCRVEELLDASTEWDMELYAYARSKLGRDPTGGLYESYADDVKHDPTAQLTLIGALLALLVAVVCPAAAVLYMVVRCCRWCGRRLPIMCSFVLTPCRLVARFLWAFAASV